MAVVKAAGFTALSHSFGVYQDNRDWHWRVAETTTGLVIYDLGVNRREEDAVQLAFLAVERIDFVPLVQMARQFLPKLPPLP